MPFLGDQYEEAEFQEYRIPRGFLYTQVLNDCLHNHPEARIRDIMAWYRVGFSFRLEEFYLCLTGVKKDIYYSVYGQKRYGTEIYDGIRLRTEALLAAEGYGADVFMVLKEDVKQMAVLFSPGPDSRPPLALAEEIGRIAQAVYEEKLFRGEARYCNVTSLAGPISGFAGIREGYLQAQALNDLGFFRMEPVVLTAEEVARRRNGADYRAVMDACTLLSHLVDEGDGDAAIRQLRGIFLSLLKESYSAPLCRDALSFCKHMLQVRCTVRDLLGQVDLERLCDLGGYLRIEECADALAPVLSSLCAAVKRDGVWPQPVLLAAYYVKGNYACDISLPEVARYANVTANYLSTSFKGHTGMALRDYITKIRVEAARKLLAEEGMKVAEAAKAVGFYDTKYFTRVFKKLTGVSPAQYREGRQ